MKKRFRKRVCQGFGCHCTASTKRCAALSGPRSPVRRHGGDTQARCRHIRPGDENCSPPQSPPSIPAKAASRVGADPDSMRTTGAGVPAARAAGSAAAEVLQHSAQRHVQKLHPAAVPSSGGSAQRLRVGASLQASRPGSTSRKPGCGSAPKKGRYPRRRLK